MHANWAVIALVGAVGCHEARLPVRPLPELVVARAATAPPIVARELMLVPGETMIWNIHWKGFTVARAELVIGEHDVTSRLRTGALASSVAKIDHALTTVLDRDAAHPRSVTDELDADGEITRTEASFEGASYTVGDPPQRRIVPGELRAHTAHTALGAIRTWAQPDAPAGFVFIVHAGELYRFDLARPLLADLQGAPTLRIEGRVRANSGTEEPIAITIWLTANDARTPLRIEIASPKARITAELIDA